MIGLMTAVFQKEGAVVSGFEKIDFDPDPDFDFETTKSKLTDVLGVHFSRQ